MRRIDRILELLASSFDDVRAPCAAPQFAQRCKNFAALAQNLQHESESLVKIDEQMRKQNGNTHTC